MCMMCFVKINSILFNLLCVWIMEIRVINVHYVSMLVSVSTGCLLDLVLLNHQRYFSKFENPVQALCLLCCKSNCYSVCASDNSEGGNVSLDCSIILVHNLTASLH